MENERSSSKRADQPGPEDEKGFGSIGARLDRIESDMREGFARVGQEFRDLRAEMNSRFLALDGDFKSLQRTLIGSTIGAVAAIIAAQNAVKLL